MKIEIDLYFCEDNYASLISLDKEKITCVSTGKTKEEAIENAKESFIETIDNLKREKNEEYKEFFNCEFDFVYILKENPLKELYSEPLKVVYKNDEI